MSQQTIVAVAITLAVVAVILVVVLLWPLGRLPCGHDERQAVPLAFGRGVEPMHIQYTFQHFDTERIVSTSNSIRVELGEGRRAHLYTA